MHQIGNYITCKYDEIYEEDGDVCVIFLYPPGPTKSFSWACCKDFCHIPFNNILTVISPPKASPTVRVYNITNKEYTGILKLVLA